jgi:hypothetical protein
LKLANRFAGLIGRESVGDFFQCRRGHSQMIVARFHNVLDELANVTPRAFHRRPSSSVHDRLPVSI